MKIQLFKHVANYERKLDFLKIFQNYGETAGVIFYTVAHLAFALMIVGASLAVIDSKSNESIALKSQQVNEAIMRWNKANLGEKLKDYTFAFKPLGKNTQKITSLTNRQISIKGNENRKTLDIPTSPSTFDDVTSVYPELNFNVSYTPALYGKESVPVCMNLFHKKTSDSAFKSVVMQDLCSGSRVQKGLSYIPWITETLTSKDLGNCSPMSNCQANCTGAALNGVWDGSANTCYRIFVAKEVCGLVFPGEVDVAYLGGCYGRNQSVRYVQLKPDEIFNAANVQITLRHPADPVITAMRVSGDHSIFVPSPPEATQGSSGMTVLFFAIGGILFALLSAVAILVKRRQKYIALKIQHTPQSHVEFSDVKPLNLRASTADTIASPEITQT